MGLFDDKPETMEAATFFMQRAQEAIAAADTARSTDAVEALYKEAETWIYMASRCLNPASARRPEPLKPPLSRAATERRSFSRED